MRNFHFWGSVTVGTKGQIVIPAEARTQFNLKEGDKLLIVSSNDKPTLVAIKPEILEEYLGKIQTNIATIINHEKGKNEPKE